MSWNPQQYTRFAGQRLRPALDLIARIPLEHPQIVVDLGCGTGNVTRILRSRWPGARITGVDGSPQMLAEARKEEADIGWEQSELGSWNPAEKHDLVFSNAALHWLDDHPVLFARLAGYIASGGVLAVQMPRNFAAPSHRLMHELASSPPWRDALARLLRPMPVLEPAAYYGLLAPLARSLDIWETEYLQTLEGENPVAEWTKGTWLAPLLAALAPGARAAFEAEYRQRVAQAYPRQPDGKTMFPFRRLFIVAVL
ncbi:MAG: methyltransferase domain-containing protein [Betaproteobacteria bacterium]|nr:methyltransferase domain-containing protein [Betaproteobacteria bacterium]